MMRRGLDKAGVCGQHTARFKPKDAVLVALHVKPDKMPELKRETFTA
jgi:hypothetical protein